MTVTIDLPPVIEQQIQEIAEGKGMSLRDAFTLFLEDLATHFNTEAEEGVVFRLNRCGVKRLEACSMRCLKP